MFEAYSSLGSGSDFGLIDEPVVKDAAAAHNKKPAQVMSFIMLLSLRVSYEFDYIILMMLHSSIDASLATCWAGAVEVGNPAWVCGPPKIFSSGEDSRKLSIV